MCASILDAPVAGRSARSIPESLGACTEELARLRFSIVLTAKWESSEHSDLLHRKELRADLDQLHTLYFQKIDEIAMTFGVQAAMEAKEKVERAVSVLPGLNAQALQEKEQEESRFDI